MATQLDALVNNWAGQSQEQVSRQRGAAARAEDKFRLPLLPNQEIYFFRKRIDNSRVVRRADPTVNARCRRWIVTVMAITLATAGLSAPRLYGILAGYEIESLKAEQEKLLAERASLDVEEARLLSSENLEQLARTEQYLDPDPQQVVFLPPAHNTALAYNAHSK